MYSLKSDEKYNIQGRGLVYVFNSAPATIKVGCPVIIDGDYFVVRGIERFKPSCFGFGTPSHLPVGLLVKPCTKEEAESKQNI